MKVTKKIVSYLLAILLMVCPLEVLTIKADAATQANINTAYRKQTIRGFGGMNHTIWAGDLTAAQRETAFGNGNNQLGFSILRIHVDENRNNWSKELATAKAAIAKGAIVFASPWNPPDNMVERFTHNGKANQKRLRHDKYADYARHLNDFVTYMKNNGVNLYAISIQNEPDYADQWTWWTPQEVLEFMRNYAGSINCKVIAPESFSYLKNMSDPILNDPKALANMDILGTHFYGTQVRSMPYPLFKQKGAGKELWMTEVYVPNSDSNSADRWPEAIDVSYNMHNALVEGDLQAYVWWYIRRSYGPMKENGSISKRGYCMAQYSKFIRPGYVRVDATKNPNNNVYVSAYTGDNKVVIVAINKGNSAVNQTFNIQNSSVSKVSRWTTSGNANLAKGSDINVNNGNFTAQLPAQSVTTYVGTINGGGTPTPDPTPTTTLSDGWYYIKNQHAQKYLQVKDNYGKAVQNVELSQGTGAKGQKWYLKNVGNGYITLKSALGDFMLDVAGAEDKNGTNIQIYNAYSGDAQQFMLKPSSVSGAYIIATKASNLTKALDDYNFGTANGTNVCQWTIGGQANQIWHFEKTNN
ncbi:MAG: glucuronoarabinoxylan endo-1,4-beta-xylanase [Clostridium sp.]|nr:glucuronoarabinoxylan endo-1,4-beta-xylanase [Clostridium sp.]